jgi:hypothetical protein
MARASDRERRHFAAIAAGERESEVERVARAAATPRIIEAVPPPG